MLLGTNNKNRKWQTRPLLSKGRYYYIRRSLQWLLVVCVLSGVTGLFFYFKNSDALCLQNITVSGDLNHLTRDDVVTLSELTPGDKLFESTLNVLRKKIARHPWVADVKIRRKFPDTIQIHVTEKKAKALLLANKLYLIDEEGRVFKPLEKNEPADLPIMTGFREDATQQHPHLTKDYFQQTLTLLDFLQQQDFYNEDSLSELHFDPVYGFTVYTKNRALEIYYGRDSFVQKQQTLEKFKLSDHYHNERLTRLDLDTPGRVIARQTALPASLPAATVQGNNSNSL